jgi:alkylation response protein AidB-like acyl-CoA dehydrogenase
VDFDLSEEQKMFQQAVRDFAEKEITPLIDEAEENEKYPEEIFPKAGDLGYLCVRYSAKYGAAEAGKTGECIFNEELARVCVGICSGLMVQSGIGTSAVYDHGSEELKQRFLVPAIKGRKVGALGLTEPNAGSDAASLQATATKDGNNYILNGTKTFITNGTFADFITVPAWTDKTQKASQGISMLVLEKGTPGFSARKLNKMAFRSQEVAELSFENCPIPQENLVGEEGRGFVYVLKALAGGRLSHSSRSLGLARAAFEASMSYGQERVQFGQPIGKFQVNTFKLVDMAVELEAARWLMYHACWLFDNDKPYAKEAFISKLFASEMAVRIADTALQIHGGYGFVTESPIQRYSRDAKLFTITEGTSEVQRIAIGRELGI